RLLPEPPAAIRPHVAVDGSSCVRVVANDVNPVLVLAGNHAIESESVGVSQIIACVDVDTVATEPLDYHIADHNAGSHVDAVHDRFTAAVVDAEILDRRHAAARPFQTFGVGG